MRKKRFTEFHSKHANLKAADTGFAFSVLPNLALAYERNSPVIDAK